MTGFLIDDRIRGLKKELRDPKGNKSSWKSELVLLFKSLGVYVI